jgi:hypothetical protein
VSIRELQPGGGAPPVGAEAVRHDALALTMRPGFASPPVPGFDAAMPALTRRRDPHRADRWRVYYGDVHVGTIAKPVGNPNAAERWQRLCGFCACGVARACWARVGPLPNGVI